MKVMDWKRPARTYAVRPDGRVELRVILNFGAESHAVTPWHTARNPMRLVAADIARDCGLPEGELPGREFTATGDETGLRDFALAHDPRL